MSEEVEESSKKQKYLTWDERINGRTHKITPRIKRFIYEYVSKGEGKTLAEFARHFKVHSSTIATWLAWPEVKREIEKLLLDTESRTIALLENRQEELIKGLLKMFKDEEVPAETRRKIAYNLLSFGKLRDANVRGMIAITQQQATVNRYENMTTEEMEKEIKELDELMEE